MPPKSNKKLRGKAKKNMLVTSRLMAISLLIDDYIYKNKPISLKEAMKFDEEITFLKLKCERDSRSLQVVEKLKIFMKSIIKEQTMDKLQDDVSGFATNTCGDDNPFIEINIISGDVAKKNTNNNWANTTKELESYNERQNTEISKTTQDTNTQTKISTNVTSAVISVEIKQIEPNDIQTQKNILKLNDKSEENILKNIDFDKDNHLVNGQNEKDQTRNDPLIITQTNLQKQSDQVCISQEQISVLKTNEINKETKNEEIQTKANKRKLYKNKISLKTTIQTKAKKVTNNSKKGLENKSSDLNKSKIRAKQKKQVDLSWIENIRYIREISPDERTDLQIDDSFWDNLSLPGNCSSGDFD